MTNNALQVARQISTPRIFYAKSDSKASGVEKALATCLEEKHRPLFAPELLGARIEAYRADPQNVAAHPLFQNWFTTQSLRATGRDSDGKAWVVYAHVPHYFSKPENIAQAMRISLRNGAGRMPHKAFLSLLDCVDNTLVFVVPHETLKRSENGFVPVESALGHPQTIPFAGGRELAESYLEVHTNIYGNKIGNLHYDDLAENPDDVYGRLLFVGDDVYDSLLCDTDLYNNGRFAGVFETGEACCAKNEKGKGQGSGFVEAKSASGFQQGRKYDIEVGDDGKYVHEDMVIQAVNIVKSGGKYPSELVADFEKTLERNLRKGKEHEI